MNKHQLACAILAGCVITCIAYTLVPTAPRYYPIEHLWRWEKLPGVPSMAWYAQSAWSLTAGLATTALAAIIFRFLSPATIGRTRTLLTLALVLAFPYALLYLALHEFLWKAH